MEKTTYFWVEVINSKRQLNANLNLSIECDIPAIVLFYAFF